MANTITINPIAAQQTGQTFTVSGTWRQGAVSAPSMTYKDGSGSATAFPGGSSVPAAPARPAAETWSFVHPAITPAGTVTITIGDGSGATASASVTINNPAVPEINAVGVGSSVTLTAADGSVWSIDGSGNILRNGTAVAGGGGSSAVGLNVVPDSVGWGQDAGGTGWYTNSGPFNNPANWIHASPQPTINPGGGSGGGATPTFSDDFTSFNTANWVYADNPGSGRVAGGYQTSGTWIEDGNGNGNYPIVGSNINLTLKPGSGGGTSICTGCRIATEGLFSQKYGYFEATVGPIPTTANRTGFAFWMFADGETAGEYQEIDIIEVAFTSPTNYDAKASLWNTDQTLTDGIDNFSLDLTVGHTFGVDWQPGGVTFYIDRVATGSFAEPGYPNAMFMILEYTGNDFTANVNPANLPVHVGVDKVQAWTVRPF